MAEEMDVILREVAEEAEVNQELADTERRYTVCTCGLWTKDNQREEQVEWVEEKLKNNVPEYFKVA